MPQRIAKIYSGITGQPWPSGPGPRKEVTSQHLQRRYQQRQTLPQQPSELDTDFIKSGLAAAIGEAENVVSLLNQASNLVESENLDSSEKLAGLAVSKLEQIASEIAGAFRNPDSKP
jgi:hypothetical protein